MSEYTSIPCRVDGTDIPAVSDVGPAMSRTVTQNATTDGIKQTHGQCKFQSTITFKTLNGRGFFLRKVEAYKNQPKGFNFSYDLGGETFTCTGSIVSAVQAQTDQDGSASLQVTIMHEDLIDENA